MNLPTEDQSGLWTWRVTNSSVTAASAVSSPSAATVTAADGCARYVFLCADRLALRAQFWNCSAPCMGGGLGGPEAALLDV